MSRTRRAPRIAEPSGRNLDALIEEATMDAYTESEQALGFHTLIEDRLALPFITHILGIEVVVVRIELNDNDDIVAVCRCGRHTQRLPVLDLPLPSPPPEGWESIAAYRRWAGHSE